MRQQEEGRRPTLATHAVRRRQKKAGAGVAMRRTPAYIQGWPQGCWQSGRKPRTSNSRSLPLRQHLLRLVGLLGFALSKEASSVVHGLPFW